MHKACPKKYYLYVKIMYTIINLCYSWSRKGRLQFFYYDAQGQSQSFLSPGPGQCLHLKKFGFSSAHILIHNGFNE